MDLASDLAAAKASLRRLGRRDAELAALAMLASPDGAVDLAATTRALAAATGASAASILVPSPGERSLAPLACAGLSADPLNTAGASASGTLSFQLLSAGRPVLTHAVVSDLLHGSGHQGLSDVEAVVAVPIMGGGRVLGLLTFLSLGHDAWLPAAPELDFARAAAGLLVPHVLSARSQRAPALASS